MANAQLIVVSVLGVVALGCVAVLGMAIYAVARMARERSMEDGKQNKQLLACVKSLTDAVVTNPACQVERIEAEQGGEMLRDFERKTYPRPAIDDEIPAPDVSGRFSGNVG